MATVLSVPSTVAATANPGGSKIGAAGTLFFIHMWDIQADFWTPVAETTGDGDATPVIRPAGVVYGRVVLTGAMVDNQALGIANLVASNNSAISGNTTAVEGVILRWDSGREITINLTVERIRVGHNRHAGRNVYNAVSLVCHMTNETLAGLES